MSGMDFYEIQKKYRNKKIKLISSFLIKIILILFALIVGWRIGASDNDVLILENEKLSKKFETVKTDLEQKLISTKIKLREANHTLAVKNIKEGSNYGVKAKKTLSIALAKGIKEEKIIQHLKTLTNQRKCHTYDIKELSVSTENFIPPNSTLTLLGGSLRMKVQGSTISKTIEKPFFDSKKPLIVTLMYFGGKEIIEKKLPIEKELMSNRFSIKLNIIESSLRGSVIIRYKVCKS